MKTATKANPNNASQHDAIAMLTADHKKVKGIFKQYETLKKKNGPASEKAALVMEVCKELTLHAQLEEEIFYPAVREAIDDSDLMDEAEVEHAGAKDLIAQLEAMKPGDDLYDARMTVLGEQIEHHVGEEEGEMFSQAKKAKVDMVALGSEMAARKLILMEQADLPDDGPMQARTTAAARKPNGSDAPRHQADR